MNALFVGDIHGNTDWKQPVYKALSKKDIPIVFLGDYVDSFHLEPRLILKNLEDIINLRKQYRTRVTLLLGNHDYAYMYGFTNISGFNSAMWNSYRQMFYDNWELFDVAWGYQSKNKYFLATHAGLTQHFYKVIEYTLKDQNHPLYKVLVENPETFWKLMPLHQLLNYFKDQGNIMWRVGRARGGIYPAGSIIWADKYELTKNRFEGINQVVGHTPYEYIEIRQLQNDTIYFVDNYKNEIVYTLMIDIG